MFLRVFCLMLSNALYLSRQSNKVLKSFSKPSLLKQFSNMVNACRSPQRAGSLLPARLVAKSGIYRYMRFCTSDCGTSTFFYLVKSLAYRSWQLRALQQSRNCCADIIKFSQLVFKNWQREEKAFSKPVNNFSVNDVLYAKQKLYRNPS